MGYNNRLYEYLGQFTELMTPTTMNSDASVAATDFGTIRINHHSGILFIASGAGTIAGSQTIRVRYASNGTASDLAEASFATDAVLTLDTDTSTNVTLIDINLHAAGIDNDAAIFGVDIDGVDSDSSGSAYVIAIPYGGNIRKPISQLNTVVAT